ncbi:MAG: BON domain-containing protein [Dehalococcoidia bacterium]
MEKRRVEIMLGAPVSFRGVELGRVAGLGMEASTGRMAHVVVAFGAMGLELRRLDPGAIVEATPEGVTTALAPEEADRLLRLPGGRGLLRWRLEKAPSVAGAIALYRGTRVTQLQGQERLALAGAVAAKENFAVSHFILVRGGRLNGRRHLVPREEVASITSDALALEPGAAAGAWPLSRSDRELRAEIWRGFTAFPYIGEYDRRAMRVDVVDGVVYLAGNVRSLVSKRQAEQAARSVAGVYDVRNEIIDDISLEVAVGRALAADPRTKGAHVTVVAHNGDVVLRGTVASEEQAQAAAEVVKAVAGVRGVTSELKVVPPEETTRAA